MPTYEYQCTSCGHAFEKFQNMTDEPLSVCPQCGKKIKRIIGAGMGVIFKGKGFYATDYKRNNPAGKFPSQGRTCCGRTERCEKPPCSDSGVCER